MKHSFGDMNKYQEGHILETMVKAVLLKIAGDARRVGPHVSNAAFLCRSNLMATQVDDPGRLPRIPNHSNLYYYRYIKEMVALTLTWWAYHKGDAAGLEVVVRINVLEWMLDHDLCIQNETLRIPCSSEIY